jgi:ribose/xylose/arabinose/galactoside ABC-type transport system permease subunit
MVSLGLTFVLLVGGFDLSVGSALALSGIVLATLFNAAALPVGWAVAGTLAVGFAFGALINGVLIGRYKVSFLIVTLGTMSLLRGLVNLLSDTRSQPVSSSVLERVAFGAVLGVPIPVVIGALVFGLSAYVLRYTLFGRDIYAIGGSPQAARLAGLRVGLTVATCYGIAGLGAAAGGILQVGRIGAASPLVGETIMLDAAAAVLLGGTSFRGGSGGVVGTAMGVLFLGALANGLAIAGVASFWQQILTGAIVVVAAVVDKAQQSRSRN